MSHFETCIKTLPLTTFVQCDVSSLQLQEIIDLLGDGEVDDTKNAIAVSLLSDGTESNADCCMTVYDSTDCSTTSPARAAEIAHEVTPEVGMPMDVTKNVIVESLLSSGSESNDNSCTIIIDSTAYPTIAIADSEQDVTPEEEMPVVGGNLQQPAPDNSDSHEGVSEQHKRKRRKKYSLPRESEWKRNAKKIKRLQGLPYMCGTNAKFRKAKCMGAPCSSKFCQLSASRQCSNVSEAERQMLFHKFWNQLNTWQERKLFIAGLMTGNPPKQPTKKVNSKRSLTWEYHLPIGSQKYRVCKKMFAATFGMAEHTLMHWVSRKDSEYCKEKPASSRSLNAIPNESMDFIRKFLQDLSTVPSHYVRSCYAHLKFLEPGTTISALYAEYKRKAEENSMHVVCSTIFNRIFHEEQYSVFVPRKDQCDTCIGHKTGSVSDEEYEKHRELKTMAQQKKAEDKAASVEDSSLSVWTMDLQAVLLSPKTDASCMFYKTKLQLHNFTLFCLDNKEGYCYCWDECNGTLSSESFAWLQYNHFKTYLKAHPDIKHLIVWSDGCGYQNRCATVSNAHFHLAKEFNVLIEQKYLVSGHTQMECDSMQSMN